jgi:hypothetical protein
MPVTFVAASAMATVNVDPATVQLTLPALAANDTIILHVVSKAIGGGSLEIDTPSGYDEKGTVVNIDSATAADDMRSKVFLKRAVSGDSGAEVTVSRIGGSAALLAGKAYVYRGVTTTGDGLDATGVLSDEDITADDLVDFPAFDPTATDLRVCYMFAHADDVSTPPASFDNDGTTFNLDAEEESATGSDITMGIYSADRNGNALALVQIDLTATAGSHIAYAFGLIPDAGGGGGGAALNTWMYRQAIQGAHFG